MRTAACVAAAAVLSRGGLAPGTQALVFRTPAPAHTRAAGSSSCRQHQRGSFCSGIESSAAVGNVGALRSTAEKDNNRVSSLGATAAAGGETAAKAPWLDGTMPRDLPDEISAENPLRVVIAGGGVGGLLAAKYLKMQGHDVSVCVRFLTRDTSDVCHCRYCCNP